MNGDRPGKPPKSPLKAPKVDKQVGRLALSWRKRTPRGRASAIPSHAHARTRTLMHTHTHTYVHAHKQTPMYAHARTHTYARTRACIRM